ncbi:hypothetical protein V8E53_005904 [Lactarius tabidus]
MPVKSHTFVALFVVRRGRGSDGMGATCPPFMMPAEERYTWVTEIAGVCVGKTTAGAPLLWHGCG